MNFRNKARLMLSGIAVMAVIGGAFALNAKRNTDKLWTRGSLGTLCTVEVLKVTLTPFVPNQPSIANTFVTDVQNAECPLKFSIYTGA